MIIPLRSYPATPMFNCTSDLRTEILTEANHFSETITEKFNEHCINNSIDESRWLNSILFQLKNERNDNSYSIIDQFFLNLPVPEEGVDPETYYRSTIEEFIDHLIIGRIDGLTGAFLMPLIETESEIYNEDLYNVLLVETAEYIDQLKSIKSAFLDKAVEFIMKTDSEV